VPLSSARTPQATLPNGELELAIEHDAIRGVSPTDLRGSSASKGKSHEQIRRGFLRNGLAGSGRVRQRGPGSRLPICIALAILDPVM